MSNYGITGEKYVKMKDRVGIKYLSKNYGEYTIVEVLPDYRCKIRFENTGNIVTEHPSNIRKGEVRDGSIGILIFGWGINDVEYNTHKTEIIGGKRKVTWVCPYYSDWKEIVRRSSCSKHKEKYLTYKDCTVCNEWKYLSNFIKWVDSQPNRDWVNCVPDKDFLSEGNKHYSPETVVYIPQRLNLFITDSSKIRGELMLGVSPTNSRKNPYQASCRNPFIAKSHCIGQYKTELEAHKAWQAKKHEHALRLAEEQNDPRVAKALRERYAPDKDWSKF